MSKKFDGASAFGMVFWLGFGAVLLSWPVVGGWGLIGCLVGIYFLLTFFNSLERRDINDAAAKKRKRKGPG